MTPPPVPLLLSLATKEPVSLAFQLLPSNTAYCNLILPPLSCRLTCLLLAGLSEAAGPGWPPASCGSCVAAPGLQLRGSAAFPFPLLPGGRLRLPCPVAYLPRLERCTNIRV
jgi:hypothetical protein